MCLTQLMKSAHFHTQSCEKTNVSFLKHHHQKIENCQKRYFKVLTKVSLGKGYICVMWRDRQGHTEDSPCSNKLKFGIIASF